MCEYVIRHFLINFETPRETEVIGNIKLVVMGKESTETPREI